MADPVVAKTWVEIYQPVIVGLGAVVLGLLANALLEWWKSTLAERKDIAAIRKSILYELYGLDYSINNSLREFENNKKNGGFPVDVSKYIINIDREKLGKLTESEIRKLSDVRSCIAGIIAFSTYIKNEHIYQETIILEFYKFSNPDLIRPLFEQYKNAISKALSEISRQVK